MPENAPLSEDELRRILGFANPNVLRLALYQSTRDPDLASMKVNKVPLRGGAFFGYVLDEAHVPALVDKAVAFLRQPVVEQDLPTPEQQREMMSLLTGEPVTDREYAFGREELALDEFPREARWGTDDPIVPEGFVVSIIGAGASGIAAAIQFERLGIPYVVYERQSDIGGTWHLNHYPDARVDTSSFLYQFKFVKNYPWPEYFAGQEEVKGYLEHVAKKFGVYEHIVFDTELTRAEYDASNHRWTLKLKHHDGEVTERTSNVIVSAAGQFSTPKFPDFPGVEDYRGRCFHTTAWDDNYQVAGQRIAVIGNGSTGVQVMPRLAKDGAEVYAFQRTPQWISPMEGYRELIGSEIRWLFDNVPWYWNWYCYSMQVTTSGMQGAQEYDRDWQARGGVISERNDGMRETLTEYIRSKVGHVPELFEKLVPDYAPLARRLVVDNGWYEALLRDNVHLVTDGIERFTETGIVTGAGEHIELDAVVMAAGFDVSKYLWPTEYVGEGGRTIEEAWNEDGPRAYLGMTVPQFPNLFIFYGPNAQARAGAFLSWVEIWARYAAEAVVYMLEHGHPSAVVREEVFHDYNERLDAAHDNLIWEKEAPRDKNYYVNRFGRQNVNLPWRNEHYFEMVAHFNPADFELR